MKIISALFATSVATLLNLPALAAEGPYSETADAKQEIRLALSQADSARVPVIIVFGANWCPDCRVLDIAMKSGASAPLMAKDFKVVKVNVGRYDKNMDVAESYGVPLKEGIPAVVVVAPDNKVLYVTRSGELADARSMGDAGIYEFFKRTVAQLKP